MLFAMHKIEHRVIYGDTDAGQVAYYANYFRWFESGRREIMRALGISYVELEKSSVITPVVEAHCNYFHPARYDDIVVVETKISEIKEKRQKASCFRPHGKCIRRQEENEVNENTRLPKKKNQDWLV